MFMLTQKNANVTCEQACFMQIRKACGCFIYKGRGVAWWTAEEKMIEYQ